MQKVLRGFGLWPVGSRELQRPREPGACSPEPLSESREPEADSRSRSWRGRVGLRVLKKMHCEHHAHECLLLSALFGKLTLDAHDILGSVHSKVWSVRVQYPDFKTVLQCSQLFE